MLKKNTDTVVNYLGYLLLALVVSASWFNVNASNHGFVKAYVLVFGSVLISIIVWRKILKKPICINFSPIRIVLSLFLILMISSLFWSVNIGFSMSKISIYLSAILIFLLALGIKPIKTNFIKLAWFMVIAGGIIALLGIFQHLFDVSIITQAAHPASTFGNKNMAAQVLIMLMPLSVYLFLQKISTQKIWLLSGISAFMLVFLFYTSTRASWLGFVLEVMLITSFLLWKKPDFNWHKVKTKAALSALLVSLILFNFSASGFKPFYQHIGDRAQSIAESITPEAGKINARFEIWKTAQTMIEDKPIFGSGVSTFYHNLVGEGYGNTYALSYQRVHNDLIELLVELGFAGFLLFIFLAITIVLAIVKILKQKEDEFYYFAFVALAGSLLNMQFSFPYQMAVPVFLFAIYAGTITRAGDKVIHRICLNAFLSRSIQAFAVIVFSFFIVINLQWVNSYNYANNYIKNLSKNHHQFEVNNWFLHVDFHTQLHSMGVNIFDSEKYQHSIAVENFVLNTWNNDFGPLLRKAQSLIQLKRYSEVQPIIDNLKNKQPKGMFYSEIINILLHEAKGNTKKVHKLIDELSSIDENILGMHKTGYLFLFSRAMKLMRDDVPYFYQQHKKHVGYNCTVENNVAIYYYRKKLLDKAKQHVDNIKQKNGICTNPKLIKALGL